MGDLGPGRRAEGPQPCARCQGDRSGGLSVVAVAVIGVLVVGGLIAAVVRPGSSVERPAGQQIAGSGYPAPSTVPSPPVSAAFAGPSVARATRAYIPSAAAPGVAAGPEGAGQGQGQGRGQGEDAGTGGSGGLAPGPQVVRVPPGHTLVAVVSHPVPRFGRPGGAASGSVAAGTADGRLALPVIDQRPGWLRVRLPQRPNGLTGWLRLSDVGLTSTPYRIEVDALAARLRLFDRGVKILDVPAGVGTRDHPTPTGGFYVTRVAPPPRPGFGDVVLVTSAHSPTVTDFDSSVDASVAIHGPLDAASDAAIGSRGTRLSRACVRLHPGDLDRLRVVPPGSPVDILTEVAV